MQYRCKFSGCIVTNPNTSIHVIGLFVGGAHAASMRLTTAETIILAFFNKGYTKEVKKDLHIAPMCRELKIKNIKSKDKGELMVLLAKELLIKKRVTLKEGADFYCLHRDSINVTQITKD